MCVGLAALNAKVHVAGPSGERVIAMADFHRLPGDQPERDTNLGPQDLIVAVELPDEYFSKNYSYLKLRDRLSYAFALVSVAAALPAEEASFKPVADHVLRDARGFGHNDFKIDLARRAIVRALSQAAAGTPQTQTDKRIK